MRAPLSPTSSLLNAMLLPQVGSFAYSTAGDAITLATQGADVGLTIQTMDTGDLRPAAALTPGPVISKPISR